MKGTPAACSVTRGRVRLLALVLCAEGAASAKTGTTWSFGAPNARADVRVCWSRSTQYSRTLEGTRVPSEPGVLQIRRWVREAIENTWGRYANITAYQLTWDGAWAYCGWEQEPGQIVFALSDSNRAEVGRFSDAPTRVQLDANMRTRAEYELAAISVFAQALEIIPPGQMLDRAPEPSQVLAAQSMHGLKPNGALVGYWGWCAAPLAESTPHYIVGYPCYEDVLQQVWSPRGFDQKMAVRPAESDAEQCMQSIGAPPSKVALVDCSGSQAGAYPFDDTKWVASGELCVSAESAAEGAFLKLWSCDTAPHWDVRFSPPASVRLHGTSLCAGVADAAAGSGKPLTLVDCAIVAERGTGVDFLLPQQATLFKASLCVTAADALPQVGSPLIMSSCASKSLNNSFHLRGQLRVGTNCAGFEELSAYRMPEQLQSFDCLDDASSPTGLLPRRTEWDYYWQL